MPKCSCEETKKKREEIVDACSKLYETMAYKDITIKEIGRFTSFTRTSIYNYFATKEEIFLELLMRDFRSWIEDLDSIPAKGELLTIDEAADGLAGSLAKRVRMLGLLSMSLADMQDNCRMENLIEFKKVYNNTGLALRRLLERVAPEIKEEDKQAFVCAFYPFIYGLYPYTATNKKQEEADLKTGVPCCCVCHKMYDAARPCIKMLLEDVFCEYMGEYIPKKK
ncbi:MAG: TetR family transcriptional regulator [Lachnospiraceae bacterium]|nr:TetR family transcriptional regulator [Lachnospiraceae bacterium]